MHVYLGKPIEESVAAMIIIDSNDASIGWNDIKLELARRVYPTDNSRIAQAPREQIRVFLDPYGQDIEQDGKSLCNVMPYLSRHCVLRIDISKLPEEAVVEEEEHRSSGYDSSNDDSSNSIRDFPTDTEEENSSSLASEEEYNNSEDMTVVSEETLALDSLVYGYLLTSVTSYSKESTTPIGNLFKTHEGVLMRQYEYNDTSGLIQCKVCPVTLAVTPTLDVEKILAHSDTRWHKRYLARLVHCTNSEFSTIPSLVAANFEGEKTRWEAMEAAAERVRVLKARGRHHVTSLATSQLGFGYRVEDDVEERRKKLDALRNKSAMILQCSVRAKIAAKRAQEVLESKRKERARVLQARKKDGTFLWNSMLQDLCKHCSTTSACKKHHHNISHPPSSVIRNKPITNRKRY